MMYPFAPNALPFLHPSIGFLFFPIMLALLVWVIAIKGYALWTAARNGHKIWFVALLIVNTLGLLEVVYLVWFRSKKNTGTIAPAPAPAPVAAPATPEA